MTDHDQDSLFEELQWLTVVLLRGEATKSELERFEELMLSSVEARRFYRVIVQEELALKLLLEVNESTAMAIRDQAALRKLAESPSSSLVDVAVEAEHSVGANLNPSRVVQVLQSASSKFDQSIGWRRHPIRFLGTVALLTAIVWILGAIFVLTEWNKQQLAEQSNVFRAPATAIVAKLVRSYDLEWDANSKPLADGTSLKDGQVLRLTSGLAEIQFRSGARVILEAPVDFETSTLNSGKLTFGKLFAHVPNSALGFSIATPKVLVTDLGTEFGVEVDESAETKATVFKGSVVVTNDDSDKATLRAGQSIETRTGQIVPAERLAENDFIQKIPDDPLALPTTTVALHISNASFEADRNTSVDDGTFVKGERGDFGGELTAWRSLSGTETQVAVGWNKLRDSTLHPRTIADGPHSQALSLQSGASVLNTTSTAWSSLIAGDELMLTIALGMPNMESLNWNEESFFGLTDGDANLTTVDIDDTVANSGLIANNPATGTQSGDGSLADVSFTYTVQPSDLQRNGNIGILICAKGSGANMKIGNQSTFDNVRLRRKTADKLPSIPPAK